MTQKQDIGLLLARIIIAVPMLFYGISKLGSGVTFIEGLLTAQRLPGFLAYGVYVGEVVAPVMLLIGFRTRLAGLLFATNCLVAILLVQTSNIFKLNDNGGWALELLGIYLVMGLVFYCTGSGRLALSANRRWD